MNRTIIAAALSLSSVFAPIAAHAGTFHDARNEQRSEFRQEGDRARPVAQPVFAAPMSARHTLSVRHVDHGRQEGWRMQRRHEIRSGRMRFEHGRR